MVNIRVKSPLCMSVAIWPPRKHIAGDTFSLQHDARRTMSGFPETSASVVVGIV